MEVCKSFEAYLLEQVMKSMEKTIPYAEKRVHILNISETCCIRNMQKALPKTRG